jgi:hypothetical protein
LRTMVDRDPWTEALLFECHILTFWPLADARPSAVACSITVAWPRQLSPQLSRKPER